MVPASITPYYAYCNHENVPEIRFDVACFVLHSCRAHQHHIEQVLLKNNLIITRISLFLCKLRIINIQIHELYKIKITTVQIYMYKTKADIIIFVLLFYLLNKVRLANFVLYFALSICIMTTLTILTISYTSTMLRSKELCIVHTDYAI